jgi:protein-disulfide isomerase
MAAQARIGTDVSQAHQQLAGLGLEGDGATFTAAEGFSVTTVDYGGLLFAMQGSGTLADSDTLLLGEVVGIATGMGEGIAGPVSAFLAANAQELAGQGPVAIPVEGSFVLTLELTPADLEQVSFAIGLQEIDEALFPPARHVLGNPDAGFVIREFSDFQCPHCANFSRNVLPLLEREVLSRGDVRFELHHLPLVSIHANAVPAAEAVECVTAANDAATFWSYGSTVLERLQAWQGLSDTGPYFISLASELGLGTDGVAECLADRTYLPEIQASYQIATSVLGINGTPALFLNGFKVAAWNQPASYLELIELIDARNLSD